MTEPEMEPRAPGSTASQFSTGNYGKVERMCSLESSSSGVINSIGPC